MAWLIRLYEVFYFSALCKNAGECKKKSLLRTIMRLSTNTMILGKENISCINILFQSVI